MLEVYRGSPNQWECDEMGHMNVRFYIARFMEALGVLAVDCRMPDAFTARANSTLAPQEMHIRFLKEAHAGAPICMAAGVLDVREHSALVYMELRHLSGEVAATYRAMIDHVDVLTRQAFAWSPATRKALERLKTSAPADIGPRSIDMTQPARNTLTLEEAAAVGAPRIGLFTTTPPQCDMHGYLLPEMIISRLSDCATNLSQPYIDALQASHEADGRAVRVGAAAVEYRLVFRKWPRAGAIMAVHSSLGASHGKARSFIHWIMDPVSGDAWASAEAVILNFDLDTRRAVAPTEDAVALLEKTVPKGLGV